MEMVSIILEHANIMMYVEATTKMRLANAEVVVLIAFTPVDTSNQVPAQIMRILYMNKYILEEPSESRILR